MKKRVIFCVDDEKIVLNSLKTELKNAFGQSYIIEIAESGNEALEAIDGLLEDNYEVPLVIADYVMPVMKGDEFLAKSHEKLPNTLNILLTGQATVEAVANSINSGGLFRYISKPWDANDLILTIKQALKSYDQEEQLKRKNIELLELSKSLEKKVKLRTLELEKSNVLLLKSHEEIKSQNNDLELYQNHLKELVEERTKDLNISKENAEENDRLKSAFLANMAHEIRTPMNGILGFSELLKNPEISGEKQQKFVDIIFNSGQRLLNTLNDLMDISKLETGQVKLKLKEININDEVENMYSLFKLEATNKGLSFKLITPIENNAIVINTDREKLYGVLSNLIKNAIKYTEKGGSIEFEYKVEGEFLVFCISDTGIGIPEDRQKAIFDRFVQADIDDTKVYEGCGLGLSIAKSYAIMFKGSISVESVENKGSKFYFKIPYTNINNNEIEVSSISNNIIDKPSEIKILIAEDEEFAAVFLSLILKDTCSEMLFAKNGKEAIDICKNNLDIDIILMDIKMPVMGGYEAVSKIREFNKEIIIIAQTAYALAEDGEKALLMGFSDYISKPIDKNLLVSKIFNNLNKK